MEKVIKKYSNRKLYNTETATYITLEHVYGFVMNAEPFKVVDVSFQEPKDITNETILRALVEHGNSSDVDSWTNLIMAYLKHQTNNSEGEV